MLILILCSFLFTFTTPYAIITIQFIRTECNKSMSDNSILTRERNLIDFLKGIAIFLVLYGHTIQYCCQSSFDFFDNYVFKIIYSFHMPFFMLISGYLFYFSFQKREIKDLVIHKTQSLLQPIIFGTILTSLLKAILHRDFSGFLHNDWIGNFGGFWFLWSVLACSLTLSLIYKTTDRFWLHIILLFFGIFFVYLFPNKTLTIYMFPYFLIGFLYSKYKDRLNNLYKIFSYISLPLFPILLIFYNKEHYIYTSGLHFSLPLSSDIVFVDLYRWLIGFVGSIFTITVIKYAFNYLYEKTLLSKLRLYICYLGKKSLQIYVLQSFFLEYCLNWGYEKIVKYLGYNILYKNTLLYNFLYTPLIAITYSIILALIIIVLEKTKINKIIFGR